MVNNTTVFGRLGTVFALSLINSFSLFFLRPINYPFGLKKFAQIPSLPGTPYTQTRYFSGRVSVVDQSAQGRSSGRMAG